MVSFLMSPALRSAGVACDGSWPVTPSKPWPLSPFASLAVSVATIGCAFGSDGFFFTAAMDGPAIPTARAAAAERASTLRMRVPPHERRTGRRRTRDERYSTDLVRLL